jgi:hypothetical protein
VCSSPIDAGNCILATDFLKAQRLRVLTMRTIARSAIMKLVHSLSRSAAVAVTLMLVAGCASSPAATLTGVEPLVGKWSGTVDRGGPRQFFYLTINADQTLVAAWGLNWTSGRITITNGQATYQMTPPPLEGTVRLYQEDGKSTLYMDDLFASFRAVVTKQE